MDMELWAPLLGRDPISMISHLLGAILSLGGTFVLVRKARQNGMRGHAVGAYGLMMTFAFGASALFHFVDAESGRYDFYNKLDHSAIFLMIAGTGTAVYGALRVQWSDRLTGALWTVSLLGMGLQLAFWSMPDWLTALIYLAVGWMGSLGVVAIGRGGERSLRLFLIGAAVFSVSAIVYAVDWPSLGMGAHEVFHLLVLVGAAFHFRFVYRHCTTRTGGYSQGLPGVDFA
jgi:hemolysin III